MPAALSSGVISITGLPCRRRPFRPGALLPVPGSYVKNMQDKQDVEHATDDTEKQSQVEIGWQVGLYMVEVLWIDNGSSPEPVGNEGAQSVAGLQAEKTGWTA